MPERLNGDLEQELGGRELDVEAMAYRATVRGYPCKALQVRSAAEPDGRWGGASLRRPGLDQGVAEVLGLLGMDAEMGQGALVERLPDIQIG